MCPAGHLYAYADHVSLSTFGNAACTQGVNNRSWLLYTILQQVEQSGERWPGQRNAPWHARGKERYCKWEGQQSSANYMYRAQSEAPWHSIYSSLLDTINLSDYSNHNAGLTFPMDSPYSRSVSVMHLLPYIWGLMGDIYGLNWKMPSKQHSRLVRQIYAIPCPVFQYVQAHNGWHRRMAPLHFVTKGIIIKFHGSCLCSFLRQGQSVGKKKNQKEKSGFLMHGGGPSINIPKLDKLTISICHTHTQML